MSDPGGPPRPGGLPPPRLRPWAGLPWIWAVPVIALVIAAWLGLRTISDRGPVITISFANAEGIELGRNEAARTTIRYKNASLAGTRRRARLFATRMSSSGGLPAWASAMTNQASW